MTPAAAKKIIKAALDEKNLTYTKLTAKTVSFMDLARDSKLFVKVHGWKPHPAWDDLEKLARANGFIVETEGDIFMGDTPIDTMADVRELNELAQQAQ